MAVDEGIVEQLLELFDGMGGVRAKRMFGGIGLYSFDTFFAIADEGAVYLKADSQSRALFEDAGSTPFTFEKKDGRVIDTSYWSLPDAAIDDPEEAVRWGRLALDAALRNAVGKRKKKPKAT